MHHKLVCAVIGLMTIAAISTPVFAQIGFPAGPPPPGSPPVSMMLAGLTLTTEQQSAVAAIMKSHQPAITALMDQLHSERKQITALLLSSGQVDLSDFTALQQQSAQTEQQLQQETLKAALEVRAVLTADQLATAMQNQNKLEQLHGEVRLIMGPPPGIP